MKSVFVDQHHLGLYNSFHLLFEKRLGWNLYRPIGTEWLDKGYWRIAEIYHNHPATIAQYLGIPANALEIEKGIYKIWEQGHEFFQFGITYEKFMEVKPEIVIASVPEHISSFKRLASEVGAKMVYQLGNSWPASAGLADNIMASANIDGFPESCHAIKYHQEFSLDIFHPAQFMSSENIYSFINCLNTASIYQFDWELFKEVEKAMPYWKFKSFGGSCRDGVCNGQKEVAETIRLSKFVWHTKNGGDGYGHILYNSAACGRPTIIKLDYYKGKMGEELLEDGVTCITIDGLSINQIVAKINYYAENNRYEEMSKNVRSRFLNKVNFDKEEAELKNFFQNLL